MLEIEKHFRPEFLNRLDDVIVFRSLTREDLSTIIEYEFSHVRQRAAERGIELRLSDEAREYLITKGYSPDFGARPLKRVMERDIEDPLSEDILRGKFTSTTVVTVRVENEALTFETSDTAPAEKTEAADHGA